MRWMILLVAACGRADPAPHVEPSPPPQKLLPIDAQVAGCPPLAITLEGQPQTPSAIARGAGAAYQVDVANEGSLTCDQLVPHALFVVGALRQPSNTQVGISVGSDFERATTRIVGTPPTKRGDPLEVCVDPPVTVSPKTGHLWLTVGGLIHATYCGEAP